MIKAGWPVHLPYFLMEDTKNEKNDSSYYDSKFFDY